MAKKTKATNILRGPLPEIAKRVSKRMADLKFSSKDLADKCAEAAYDLDQIYDDRDYQSFNSDDDKIRHLLMWRSPKPGSAALKGIEIEVVEIIAYALRVPPDYLIGTRHTRSPIIWDPLADTDQTEFVKLLMKTYEEQTGEFIGWAEFLPCSLETKKFMELHHEAMFSRLNPRHGALVISKFNDIGNSRRGRLLRYDRRYSFTLLMYLSDLRRIAEGKDEYQLIDSDMRRECFQNLSRILEDEAYNIGVIVAHDKDVEDLKVEVEDTDGIIVMGKEYTQWRLHRGDVQWSEHSYWIKKHRNWINEFQKRAAYKTAHDIIGLLTELATTVK